MKPYVFSCITPHGGEIISALAGKHPERMEKTCESMRQLGKEMTEAKPDAIVIITPHGTRIDGMFSIANSETMTGDFSENNRTYFMKRDVRRDLVGKIAENAKEDHIPIGVLNYGTSSGPLSNLILDWGAIVPLDFMPDIPIVVITPSRLVSYDLHIKFGQVLTKAVKESGLKVGLIASCDWSHTHDEKGPYGFHSKAKTVDEYVVNLITNNNLEDLVNISEQDIEEAKPDGIWQSLILAGAIPKEKRKIDFLSYEAPTYFGLICAVVR